MDLHTPRESHHTESSKEGDAAEEADPPTYYPQVPEGHEQLAAHPEVQQIEEELEQLNINIIAAHHLPPILQVLPPDPPQFLAPPVAPIFMANVQPQQQQLQQQQPPPP